MIGGEAPQHPLPAEDRHAACEVAFMRPRLLRVISYVVRQAGGDPERLCLGLGFSTTDLNDADSRYSLRQLAEFVKRASRVLPDAKEILLHAASNATITQYDVLGFGQLSCATLGEALELGIEFQRLFGMAADLALERGRKEFRFTLDDWFQDAEVGPFFIELACAFTINEISLLLGRRFVPVRVEFAHGMSPRRVDFPRVFGCPVVFDAPRTCIVGPVVLLDTRLATYDRLTHDGLVVKLRRESVAYQSDLLEAVGHMLRKDLRSPPSIAEVAERMHMSERSLRRRLHEGGISFRELLARVRAATSAEMLRHGRLTVEEVAELVGFSSAEHLRRAFKRWTGKPPSALKQPR